MEGLRLPREREGKTHVESDDLVLEGEIECCGGGRGGRRFFQTQGKGLRVLPDPLEGEEESYLQRGVVYSFYLLKREKENAKNHKKGGTVDVPWRGAVAVYGGKKRKGKGPILTS